MATCNSVITLALGKLGIVGGSKAARPEDLAIGLTTLQSLYRELISGKLGRARPVIPSGDYVARENDRIYRNNSSVGTISLPDMITEEYCGWDDTRYYDYTICSHPRPPRDGSFVIINDAVSCNSVEYIYEGYINQWVSVHDLSLQEYQEITDPSGNVIEVIQPSVAPLSTRDLNGLAALLATKMVDYYGASLNPATINDAQNWKSALASGLGEPEEFLYNDLLDCWGPRY